jgi:hypothetical protein
MTSVTIILQLSSQFVLIKTQQDSYCLIVFYYQGTFKERGIKLLQSKLLISTRHAQTGHRCLRSSQSLCVGHQHGCTHGAHTLERQELYSPSRWFMVFIGQMVCDALNMNTSGHTQLESKMGDRHTSGLA